MGKDRMTLLELLSKAGVDKDLDFLPEEGIQAISPITTISISYQTILSWNVKQRSGKLLTSY